jgi:hypothetical protein
MWAQIVRDQVKFFGTEVGGMLSHTHYEEVAKGFGAHGKKKKKIFVNVNKKIFFIM